MEARALPFPLPRASKRDGAGALDASLIELEARENDGGDKGRSTRDERLLRFCGLRKGDDGGEIEEDIVLRRLGGTVSDRICAGGRGGKDGDGERPRDRFVAAERVFCFGEISLVGLEDGPALATREDGEKVKGSSLSSRSDDASALLGP